jgi:UDP-glucose 4-epimerase
MTYLVTGGAGFIGSNIVEELLKQGQPVKVLYNFSTGKRENLEQFEDSVEIIEGDLRSYHLVREAVESVDYVLHQAALPSVPRSIKDPLTTNAVNVEGTLNILHAALEAGVKRVVFASSSSIYGDSPSLPKREDMPPNPLSPYAISKLAGEKYCQVFAKIYGLHTVSLRYFNVFGPRQNPDSQYSAVIPKFIKRMLKDSKPVIYGDGEQSRDFTFVKNVVNANILATKVDCPAGSVMNCAAHERTTLNSLVKKLNNFLSKDIVAEFTQERPGDIKHSFADIESIKQLLGFRPEVFFQEGLEKTVSWYKDRA